MSQEQWDDDRRVKGDPDPTLAATLLALAIIAFVAFVIHRFPA